MIKHISFLLVFAVCCVSPAEDRLVVHEWGTFTSLQDEQGESIGGINVEDEPLPEFTHDLASRLLIPRTQVPRNFFQGVPMCHPDITMRLETPVIYFHPPKSGPAVSTIDVKVKFRGGWLTQFYPCAQSVAPGIGPSGFGHLTENTIGELAWSNLRVGGTGSGPPTEAHVWTSPRAVDAAALTTPNVGSTDGESEKFLFYRGVGHLAAPIRISRDNTEGKIHIQSQLDPSLKVPSGLKIEVLWLVEVRADGTSAFRQLSSVALDGNPNKILTSAPSDFYSQDFSRENLGTLREAMRQALVKQELFADEAIALLNTWELSYFKSPGQRLFFLVPREWTDAVLPLQFSKPCDVERVMVGRIELVTPAQRTLLRKIASSPKQSAKWVTDLQREWLLDETRQKKFAKAISGEVSLAELGISSPDDYQAYLDLGRFRDALVLRESNRPGSAGLRDFAEHYSLSYYPVR